MYCHSDPEHFCYFSESDIIRRKCSCVHEGNNFMSESIDIVQNSPVQQKHCPIELWLWHCYPDFHGQSPRQAKTGSEDESADRTRRRKCRSIAQIIGGNQVERWMARLTEWVCGVNEFYDLPSHYLGNWMNGRGDVWGRLQKGEGHDIFFCFSFFLLYITFAFNFFLALLLIGSLQFLIRTA